MSGVTESTVKNLILDAGAVYVDYGEVTERLLGATSGGSSFSIEREIREIEVDGVKGKTKGLRRITKENASLKVNLKEMSKENLLLALPGSTAADFPASPAEKTHDSITSDGVLVDADYATNVAFVGTVSGGDDPVVIVLTNPLADGDFEMSFEDEDEAGLEVQFSAHYDPAALDTVPYEIRYPVIPADES